MLVNNTIRKSSTQKSLTLDKQLRTCDPLLLVGYETREVHVEKSKFVKYSWLS